VDPQVGELWARCRMGDTDARAALIELYRPLAVVAAKRFRLTSDALDSLEDREAAGTIGLIQAVDRYDPAREVPFEVFARVRVRGAIIDEMRRLDERARVVHESDGEPMQRTASLDELAERGDRPDVAESDGIDERIARDGLRHDVSAALGMIAQRERTILAAYYTEGLTLAAIGARFGFSESRACQIHSNAIRQLRSLLGVGAGASIASAA